MVFTRAGIGHVVVLARRHGEAIESVLASLTYAAATPKVDVGG